MPSSAYTIEPGSSHFFPNGVKKVSRKTRFNKKMITAPAPSTQLLDKSHWYWGLGHRTQDLQNEVKIAQSLNCNIVIIGETGTGKELIANLIHQGYRESKGFNEIDAPFVPVNCGAIPSALAESILFGHERGAFTSARGRQYGKFELARKGTLFLDEIQNLELSLQAKLLRVLQIKEIDRLGAQKSDQVSCRVISACNVPLEYLVDKKQFRKDLYYRVNIFPIYIPALRHRKEDLPVIIKGLNQKISKERKITPLDLDSDAFELLLNYNWPGNIRELEHSLVYANLKASKRISIKDLPAQITGKLEKYLQNGDWQI